MPQPTNQSLMQLSENGKISYLTENGSVYFCFNGKKGACLYSPFKNLLLTVVKAIASSVFSSGYPEHNAYDNNLSTGWLSANISTQAWITFDLGSKKSVHKAEVVVCHSHSTGSYLGNLTIYGSNDGSNFYEINKISDVTYNSYAISYSESNYINLFSDTEHEYRYFKLEMDSKSNSPGVKNIRFYE